MRDLPAGVIGRHEHLVTDAETARQWGNELPVLATPVLLWLGEIAAMQAVADYLGAQEMTLGVAHNSAHVAPTPVGHRVTVQATLRERQGRILVFDVVARDRDEVVLRGTHTRAVVDRTRFGVRVAAKSQDGVGCVSCCPSGAGQPAAVPAAVPAPVTTWRAPGDCQAYGD
jgi:predicted thioesterase